MIYKSVLYLKSKSKSWSLQPVMVIYEFFVIGKVLQKYIKQKVEVPHRNFMHSHNF